MSGIQPKESESRWNVLIVEDDPKDLVLTKRALNRAMEDNGLRANLWVVGSAEEAIEAVHVDTPDFMLIDIALPGINGIECLQLLKSDEKTRRIPAIMLTSSTAETDIIRSWDNHCAGYLEKPLNSKKFTDLAQITMQWMQVNKLPA